MNTVAEQIGQTPHLSPLLRRLRRLGFINPDDLRRLAVQRGCDHYRRPEDSVSALADPGPEELTNEELAVALISGAQQFDSAFVRCAAQLLSAPAISSRRLVRLAREERAIPVLRHIARAGLEIDDVGREQWRRLIDALPATREVPEGRLPHRSRFVSETGLIVRDRALDRTGRTIWLRPRASGPA